MWRRRNGEVRGRIRFFLICCSYNTLRNYYELNYVLTKHHKYNLSEIEALIPWEREVYVNMWLADIQKQKDQQT